MYWENRDASYFGSNLCNLSFEFPSICILALLILKIVANNILTLMRFPHSYCNPENITMCAKSLLLCRLHSIPAYLNQLRNIRSVPGSPLVRNTVDPPDLAVLLQLPYMQVVVHRSEMDCFDDL